MLTFPCTTTEFELHLQIIVKKSLFTCDERFSIYHRLFNSTYLCPLLSQAGLASSNRFHLGRCGEPLAQLVREEFRNARAYRYPSLH
jgi:hypothetical protein